VVHLLQEIDIDDQFSHNRIVHFEGEKSWEISFDFVAVLPGEGPAVFSNTIKFNNNCSFLQVVRIAYCYRVSPVEDKLRV